MSEFKLRKLHRQRRGRRSPVQILDHQELAAYFRVPPTGLKIAMDAAGWNYHEDANGHIWATPQDSHNRHQIDENDQPTR